MKKMGRKLPTVAMFIVTQPILEWNEVFDRLLEKYPDLSIIAEAWMSKKQYPLIGDIWK